MNHLLLGPEGKNNIQTGSVQPAPPYKMTSAISKNVVFDTSFCADNPGCMCTGQVL